MQGEMWTALAAVEISLGRPDSALVSLRRAVGAIRGKGFRDRDSGDGQTGNARSSLNRCAFPVWFSRSDQSSGQGPPLRGPISFAVSIISRRSSEDRASSTRVEMSLTSSP